MHKKIIVCVMLIFIIISTFAINTFALSQNEQTNAVFPNYNDGTAPFLNLNLNILAGNGVESDVYNFSINDNATQLSQTQWTTTQYLNGYLRYFNVQFREADDIMNDILSNVDLSFIERKDRLIGTVKLEKNLNLNNEDLATIGTIYPDFNYQNNEIWEYSPLMPPIGKEANGVSYLALEYWGSDYRVVVIDESDGAPPFANVKPLIVFDEELGYHYVNDGARYYYEFMFTNNIVFTDTVFEKYFVTEVPENFNISLPISKEYDDSNYYNDFITGVIKNKLTINENLTYNTGANVDSYPTQFRFSLIGGNSFLSRYDIDSYNNLPFLELQNYDCKVTYKIKYAYHYDNYLEDGRIQYAWKYKDFEQEITRTNFEIISYFPSEFVNEVKTNLRGTQFYITYYEINVFVRRYDFEPITLNIGYTSINNNAVDRMGMYMNGLISYQKGYHLPQDDINLGETLNNTVKGFFDTPIFGTITFGIIILMPLAVMLVLYILKLFAGG